MPVARSVYLGEKVVSEKEYLSAMANYVNLLQGWGMCSSYWRESKRSIVG
jgi:hypothetical protein